MGYLSVWKFSYILLIFSFPMSASNHLNASVFQHFTDTGYSWALFFAVDQTTYTNMHNFYVFTDQPVNFFQNSFVIIWFCRIHTFTSIACHHCCQTGILGIFLKKGLPFHKSLQTSHPGTDIVGMKTGQCPNFNDTGCFPRMFHKEFWRYVSYSPSPFRTVCTS